MPLARGFQNRGSPYPSKEFKIIYWFPLQCRHNWRDSISNHQPHDCLLNHLIRRRSKKISKLRVTGICAGNSSGPVDSPHKWPVTRKCFHLMTSSCRGSKLGPPIKCLLGLILSVLSVGPHWVFKRLDALTCFWKINYKEVIIPLPNTVCLRLYAIGHVTLMTITGTTILLAPLFLSPVAPFQPKTGKGERSVGRIFTPSRVSNFKKNDPEGVVRY